MVKLVLFDIDGTLIQSGGAGEKAFARVCQLEFGIENGTANLQFAGRTDPSIVRDFFSQFSIPATVENFRRFFDAYVFMLDDLLRRLDGRVLPGVTCMLHTLRTTPQAPAIGLLTGNIRLGAQIKLSHYQLWEQFQFGGFGDDHEDRNQIAAIAHQRANRLLKNTLKGHEVLVIGDTPRDVECAQAIGARTLAVATGKFTVDELKTHRPDWVASTLDEFDLAEVIAGSVSPR
jgi:phosphoglycolate phosphatase-like HAD superfamily hydrolase